MRTNCHYWSAHLQLKIPILKLYFEYMMKKTVLLSCLVLTTILSACQSNAPIRQDQSPVENLQISKQHQAALNKQIVVDFYEGVFLKHQVQSYADRYIGSQYIQHNPHVPDGKAPFVNYFTQYFKDNPEAKNEIKRAAAEGDLVYLHVHSTQNKQDRGEAIVDIFRVENGKIVEHWDVQQSIPESSANSNTMF